MDIFTPILFTSMGKMNGRSCRISNLFYHTYFRLGYNKPVSFTDHVYQGKEVKIREVIRTGTSIFLVQDQCVT